mmetsp:Transcript_8572/g.19742  ORF Transcript_8572/g.19742 Transcript_8572/m.19742 type:complete len:201 (-) Transcript_8572:137-739(-)
MANRNSYISVSLPDDTRDALSQMASAFAEAPETHFGAPVTFEPMAHKGLHMTFVFLAEELHRLKPEAVAAFHASSARLVAGQDPGVLRFRELQLFPPGKMNLVVAVFDATPGLHALQRTLVNECGLAGLARWNQEWIAHCTLGKIGASKQQLARVAISPPEIPEAARHFEANAIILCGERPKKPWLDWDTGLSFRQEPGA